MPAPSALPAPPSADSTFAATRVLTALEAGADPTSLGRGSLRTAVFVDRAAGKVYEVDKDGYPRAIAGEGDLSWGAEAMGMPVLAAKGGKDIVIFDSDGRGWRWVELSSPGYLYWLVAESDSQGAAAVVTSIDPATRAIDTVTHGRREYDVYMAEPGSGDVIRYKMRLPSEDFRELETRVERNGLEGALDLYVDPQLHVLAGAGVERYIDGARDRDFVLAVPPGEAPDYRFIDGIGSDGKGQLWLYDAAGQKVVAFDKRDGSYLESWAPGPGEPIMSDVRGMYVESDGAGSVATVTWLTPDGLMRSALTKASLLEPRSEAGTLKPSAVSSGPKAIDWEDDGLRLEADALDLRIGRKRFTAPGEVLPEGYMGAQEGELTMYWYERGIQQRLMFQLVTDDTHWWVSEIWTYDGVKGDGDWIYYEDLAPLTRTPLGEALEGDLRLTSTGADRKEYQKDGTAKLRIDGLRLTAFAPGTRPAPLTDCQYIDDPRVTENSYPVGLLQGPGEPLEGITDMSPTDAEALLQEVGLCYRFDYAWRLPERFESKQLQRHEKRGWDRRCSAPETGKIKDVRFSRDYPYDQSSPTIVYLVVNDKEVRDLPEPPPEGTDCPSQ